MLYDGAKRIGILHGGTIVFDNEDQSCVLADYCIYNVRRQGRNAVEQYLCDCSPDPGSDDMVCLPRDAARHLWVLVVLRPNRALGATFATCLRRRRNCLFTWDFRKR